jgi:C4-dicarboxylate-specific signal transduction histidine kinase
MSAQRAIQVPFFQSLTFRLLLGLCGLDLLLFLGILLVMRFFATPLVLEESLKLAQKTGDEAVGMLEGSLLRYQALARSLALVAQHLPADQELQKKTFAAMLAFHGDPAVAGGGIWFEPGAFESSRVRHCYFWGRDGQGHLQFFDQYAQPGPVYDEKRFLAEPAFREQFLASSGYHNEEWYVLVGHLRRSDATFWSRSYTDPYSSQPMVTVTAPIRKEGGQLLGVATVDLKLEGLQRITAQIAAEIGGDAFLLDRNDSFITRARLDLGQNPELRTMDELEKQEGSIATLVAALRDMDRQRIEQSESSPNFPKDRTQEIDDSSHQIDGDEARMLNALLWNEDAEGPLEPMIQVPLPRGALEEESMALVFRIPHSYWKLVILKPRAAMVQVADQIGRRLLTALSLLIACLFLVALSYHLKMIIQPIRQVTRHMARLGHELASGTPIQELERKQITTKRKGEIGMLAQVFNQMTGQLELDARALAEYSSQLESKVAERTRQLKATQRELLESAHRAGMADLAMGVLHNVGNHLTHAATALGASQEILARMPLQALERGAQWLNVPTQKLIAFLQNDPRGQKLPRLLGEGAQLLNAEAGRLRLELEQLQQVLGSIQKVILNQLDYAGANIPVEAIDPQACAMAVCLAKSQRINKLAVTIEQVIRVPGLLAGQHGKLEQVLHQLLDNALDSLAGMASAERKIHITIEVGAEKGTICLQDNGPGVAAELAETIFQSGTSTKQGAAGFGLHFCACAMQEMGGRLWLDRTQPGGCFVLELPRFQSVQAGPP